jgi:DNA-binding CsgD family transcriptional regulator
LRLHPYWSERILSGSAELSALAGTVGRHHERLDGTGYHRGCSGDQIEMSARLLAAADSYRAMLEPRPHRPPYSPEDAGRRLRGAVEDGALDGDAAAAVLVAAGHPAAAHRRSAPAGLSEREVEVLRLLARGHSNPDIARRLVISRRTAEHHVQHVYAKVGVSSRAAATLFAVRHGLVGPAGPDAGPDGPDG